MLAGYDPSPDESYSIARLSGFPVSYSVSYDTNVRITSILALCSGQSRIAVKLGGSLTGVSIA